MNTYKLTPQLISDYIKNLNEAERSKGTIEKYQRDIRDFFLWLNDLYINKSIISNWKHHLLNEGYAPITINSKLAAINGLCRFLGWNDCHVRYLKIQRRIFRDASRSINRSDYKKLITTARHQRQERIALLMETICSTGIRVSELINITVETATLGQAEVSLKGKIRTIFLPTKLCRKLIKYARKNNIHSGEIFITKSGKSLSRHQIWAEMKKIAKIAGIKSSKVFPHNLRHLFATTYYTSCKDIVRLADILGHSSINTTRIYLTTTSDVHIRQINKLDLVS